MRYSPRVVQKVVRPSAALGAVLFALLGLSACGGIPGDAVVSVNGSSITRDTFNHWLSIAAHTPSVSTGGAVVVPEPPKYKACISHLKETAGKPAKGSKAPTTKELKSQCEQQYKSLRTEVLSFLISGEWVLGEASAMNVKLTDAEVKKQFVKIKQEQFAKPSEFEKFLTNSGQTISDLLLRVKLNLLSQKIQQKVEKSKSKVTHKEIVKYYKENSSRYGTPEKREVRIVLTKTEGAAGTAKKEIESGKSFASVAKHRSTDPTSKADGGLIKSVVKGEEEKALSEAIFSAKPHVLSGPVKTPFGYYIFQVEGVTAAVTTPLKTVESSIKAALISTNQQKALSDFVKAFKKRWMAKTECRSEFKVADCKGYKLPKSSKTSTTK